MSLTDASLKLFLLSTPFIAASIAIAGVGLPVSYIAFGLLLAIAVLEPAIRQKLSLADSSVLWLFGFVAAVFLADADRGGSKAAGNLYRVGHPPQVPKTR